MANGKELLTAMTALVTAKVMKVAAMLTEIHGVSGPVKMRAAKDSP